MEIGFRAFEHRADGGFAPVALRLAGDPARGWQVERNGGPQLSLGPGFRALGVRSCGVCATDLARRFLPFPLPQVIGHEVLARDEHGARQVIEINASCRSRGLADPCVFCRAGLDHHCPERRVLGIHDLPGGFGPFVLAPERAVLPVPDALADDTAVLAEPFAAALHAVETIAPRAGDRVAVLGPRRLGALVVAALAAWRRRCGPDFEILALPRRAALGDLARALGADRVVLVEDGGAGLPDGLADVVVDTTGTPEGFELGLRLAGRELHGKSTHGRAAGGLAHWTEAVVDEIRFAPLETAESPGSGVAWLAAAAPAGEARGGADAAAQLAAFEAAAGEGVPRADAAVVDDARGADAALRPDPGREVSLVRPGGTLLVHPDAAGGGSSLLRAVAGRGLVVSTSRCGDFRAALELLAGDATLHDLGDRFVTHRFTPDALAQAFAVAASPDCVKAVVEHPDSARVEHSDSAQVEHSDSAAVLSRAHD